MHKHYMLLFIVMFTQLYAQTYTIKNKQVQRTYGEIVVIPSQKDSLKLENLQKLGVQQIFPISRYQILRISPEKQNDAGILEIVTELYKQKLIRGFTFAYQSKNKKKHYYSPQIGIKNISENLFLSIKEEKIKGVSFHEKSMGRKELVYLFVDDRKFPIGHNLEKIFGKKSIEIYEIISKTLPLKKTKMNQDLIQVLVSQQNNSSIKEDEEKEKVNENELLRILFQDDKKK